MNRSHFTLPTLATIALAVTSILLSAVPLAAEQIGIFAGKWTYRSYHNQPEVMVGRDAKKALESIFGEGVINLAGENGNTLRGTLDMGAGFVLDLEGSMTPHTEKYPAVVQMSGKGRANTATEGWQYDYTGYLNWVWPNGIDQIPSIVGTVIRVKPHGTSKAGYVASFIAAKQTP